MTSPTRRQVTAPPPPVTTSAPTSSRSPYIQNAFGLGRSLSAVSAEWARTVAPSSDHRELPAEVSLYQREIAPSPLPRVDGAVGVSPAPLTPEQQVAGLAVQVEWYQQQYRDQGLSLAKLQRFFGLRAFASYDELLRVLQSYNAVQMIFPDFYRAAGRAQQTGRPVVQMMSIDTGQGARRFKVTLEAARSSASDSASNTVRPAPIPPQIPRTLSTSTLPSASALSRMPVPPGAGRAGRRRVSTRTSSSSSGESSPNTLASPNALDSSQSSIASLRVPFSPASSSPDSSLSQFQFARVPRLRPLPEESQPPEAKRPRR